MKLKPVLNRHDVALAHQVVDSVKGAFIMGSYPVLKMEARDVDVAVPETSLVEFADKWGARFEMTHNADEEVYTDDAPSFLCNYRNKDEGGRVNVLVIRDRYVGAMTCAATIVAGKPDDYRDERARIDLYQAWERSVDS